MTGLTMPTLRVAASPTHWKDRLVLAAMLLVGGLLSVLTGTALQESEALRERELRTAASQSVLSAFDLDLTRSIEAVRGTGLMIESHPTLSREQFNNYVERVMAQLHSVSIVEWQPIVPAGNLKQFEIAARSAGLKNYQVVQPDRTGSGWEPVHGRDVYVPVLYAWPERFGTAGLDMSFSPERMQSKLEARVTGQPVASGVFDIMKEGAVASGSNGIALSVPVYRAADQSVIGYVAAVIDLPTLFQEANTRADGANMDMMVYDLNALDTRPIFAWLGDHSDLSSATPLERTRTAPGDMATTVDFARQAWEIVLHPRPSFDRGRATHFSVWVMTSGLATTLLLVLAVARVQRSRRNLQQAQVLAHQARESLASERQRLQNIIEATDAGTWAYNYTTGKLEVNDRWAAMSGMTLAEWEALPAYDWHEYCHPDDQARVTAALRSHTHGIVDHYEAEYRHRRKDGSWLWVSGKGKVLSRTPNGRPEIFAGTLTDITLRKEAQARIVELNATLENRVAERTAQLESAQQTLRRSQEDLSRSEARATLGTLAASVSHEISTPMGNSMMAASTLADEARDFDRLIASGQLRRSDLNQFVAQVAEGNTLLVRNLERAADLLKNFRQVAADQASEQRRAFDLRQAIQEVVDTLAPSLKSKPHQVVLDVASDIAMDSYPGPLGQVVINLINNAYLHAFDDKSPGLFTIAARADSEWVNLTFKDNGKGISAETLKHMFEPFFSTKIGKGGTGLGMSIVENLVTKTLGGYVTVRSTPDVGTEVAVRIPRCAPTAASE
jgi:PAS domain S-box-containing protein